MDEVPYLEILIVWIFPLKAVASEVLESIRNNYPSYSKLHEKIKRS